MLLVVRVARLASRAVTIAKGTKMPAEQNAVQYVLLVASTEIYQCRLQCPEYVYHVFLICTAVSGCFPRWLLTSRLAPVQYCLVRLRHLECWCKGGIFSFVAVAEVLFKCVSNPSDAGLAS